MADNHPDDWVDVAHDGHPDDWADVPAAEAPKAPGFLDTAGAAVAHALDAATSGQLRRAAQPHAALQDLVTGGHTADGAEAGYDAALKQQETQSPVASGLGSVAGAFLHPANAVLPAVFGAAGKAVGGAANLASKVPWAGKALSAGIKGTAGVLGAAVPIGLGAAGTMQGLEEEDPYEKTRKLAGSAPMLAAGALGGVSKLGASIMEGPAAKARAGVLDGLVSEKLPAEKAYFKDLQNTTSKVPDYRGAAESALKKQNRSDLASLKLSDRTAANDLKADFRAKQANVSEAPDAFGAARKALETQLGEQNDAAVTKLKGDAAWAKGLGTSPVGGPRAAPGAPGAEPQWTDPAAKMNKEIQDSYALARAHKELGLNLTPEAQKGLANLTPDYEARVNAELSKYAEGKGNRLQQFRDILEGRAPNPEAPPRAAPKAPQLPFKLKDASDTRAAYDLKPNPLGGFTPAEAPPLKTPGDFGVRAVEHGALKPNPLAGFAPKAPGFTPKELPPLPVQKHLPPQLLESLRGLNPEPTAASVRPGLASQVDPKIEQLRDERGVIRRLAGGAIKGVKTPVSAAVQSGSLLTGNTSYMLPAAAGFGTMGALQTAATDPVVATALSRYSQAGGKNLTAIANFLAGATGPMLAKKLDFLRKTDPEFAAAAGGEK